MGKEFRSFIGLTLGVTFKNEDKIKMSTSKKNKNKTGFKSIF